MGDYNKLIVSCVVKGEIESELEAEVKLANSKHTEWKSKIAAIIKERDELRAEVDQLIIKSNRWKEIAQTDESKRIAELEAELARTVSQWQSSCVQLGKIISLYEEALQFAYDGIDHFTNDDDRDQVLYLRKGIEVSLAEAEKLKCST